VLPLSFLDRFGEAAADAVSWRASSGATHTLRVCSGSDPESDPSSDPSSDPDAAPRSSDFSLLEDRGVPRLPVAAAIGGEDRELAALHGGQESDRLVGTLVHRMLQREGLAGDATDEWIARRVASLVRVDESINVVDRGALIARAASSYRAFSTHADLRAIYQSGDAFHEVPFSLAVDGRVVRGTIDCLVRRGEGGPVTVIEFKTGRPRPEHQAQADLYRLAAQTIFPGAEVVTRLVYSGDVTLS
jgi:hypothetical protein